ncbi:winged helix-turn-helix domain-containing protein [Pseudomonas sp. RIT-PI-S]|uniref:winged helix-turn-helix domain-containing protein n=1 Tax=Pseudomonas sp. RIT-PI-S TaxID=3035295 RepID=UPI0021DA85A2|nr:winged helix-turn-helix domain-containing protein [Pseudomonas sp. RIT-PI-S]
MNVLYIAEQPDQALMQVFADHAGAIVSTAPEHADRHWQGRYRFIVLDLPQARQDLLTKAVGRRGHARLLVVLDQSDSSTRARVLKAGADLCLPRPLSAEELQARMQALSRQYAAPAPEPAPGLWLSSNRLLLGRGNCQQSVTVTEQRLLALLAAHDEPISRQMIEDHLWGATQPSRGPLIERHICNLRRKLAELGLPYALQTLRGYGYCLNEALRLRID